MLDLMKRLYKDVANVRRYGVSPAYTPDRIGKRELVPYCLGFTRRGMDKFLETKLDDNGIIIIPNRISDNGCKYYYSPLFVSHYILAHYNDYLNDGDDIYHYPEIIRHLDFLENTKEHLTKNTPVWYVPTYVPRYKLGKHVSCLSQGQVISSMLRAYLLLEDEKYVDIALDALNVFWVPVDEGGILTRSKWGVCYEEYPTPEPYNHVVNGFMSSLIDIYELYQITGSEKAKYLYEEGIVTLKKMIPDWIMGFWSKYDLMDQTAAGTRVNIATRHYQYLHIDMLNVLYMQTGDKEIFSTKSTLESQAKNISNILRMYGTKFYGLPI